jgi:prepilin-type N-terminal cleavage/methylation domain-containing protein
MRVGPAARAGFTLIEVIGAILIFSVGVIMVVQVTGALSRRTEYAAVNSVLNVMGMQRIDSLSVLAYASVPVATTTDTVTVRGIPYRRQLVVTQMSPLVKKLDFTLSPMAGAWPIYDASTYLRDAW